MNSRAIRYGKGLHLTTVGLALACFSLAVCGSSCIPVHQQLSNPAPPSAPSDTDPSRAGIPPIESRGFSILGIFVLAEPDNQRNLMRRLRLNNPSCSRYEDIQFEYYRAYWLLFDIPTTTIEATCVDAAMEPRANR